jgi:DNA polymerase-3 subunit beta
MKFTCDKNSILREISFAQEIISTKNALSIMSNVLFQVDDGTLTIMATDVKVNLTSRIPVDTIQQGTSTVFCDKVSGILSSIPEGDIEFEQTEGKLIVKPRFKKAQFKLKTLSSEKFPEIPSIPDETYFEIGVEAFKQMIRQTVFSVSDDETRYYMNGVYFERSASGLTMVSTDGRRLAFIQKEFEGLPDFRGVIIPPKILNLVLKHAPNEGSIAIGISDKTIFFKFGTYSLSSVLIDGSFPNYQRVIPQSQERSFSFKRTDMLEAIKRVAIFVENKSRRMYLLLKTGMCEVVSEESDLGIAREEIACEYEGEDATIILNYKYIEDPLKVLDSDVIVVEFTETSRAITIKTKEPSDHFHVVMPMQTE